MSRSVSWAPSYFSRGKCLETLALGFPKRINRTEVKTLQASFFHPKTFQVHEGFIMFQVRQLGYGQQLLPLHREDPMVVQATPVASRQLLDVVLFADQLVEFGRYGHQTRSSHFGQLPHQDLESNGLL